MIKKNNAGSQTDCATNTSYCRSIGVKKVAQVGHWPDWGRLQMPQEKAKLKKGILKPNNKNAENALATWAKTIRRVARSKK